MVPVFERGSSSRSDNGCRFDFNDKLMFLIFAALVSYLKYHIFVIKASITI